MKTNWLDSMNFLKGMSWRKASPASPQEGSNAKPNVANEKQGLGVNTLLWTLVGVMALSIVGLGGFGYYSTLKELQLAEADLDEVAIDNKMITLASGAETNFKTQVQEWKNILLRGGDPALFKKYLTAFEKEESKVQKGLTSLKRLMATQPKLGADAIKRVDSVLKAHMELGVKYRDALNSYDPADPDVSAHTVDVLVKGVDRAPTDQMEALVTRLNDFTIQSVADDKKALEEAFATTTKIFIAVVLGVLVLTIVLTLPIRKNVNKILDKVSNLLTHAEKQNRRNQDAILRLLDEVADLADGNLTRKPVVTEDITGAIADSLGYAIETLRNLIGAINSTAAQVATGAVATQTTALQLTAASDKQAQEINTAGTAVQEMTKSAERVSSNAAESTAVAQQSVDIAKKGAQTVQGTIQGMETIREQIQETSKRIKRLGESSQEIGEIVGLINDIADQTNILALNASIQAAMAGDAGRGFAVVADEVQRLSERVGSSTKQIANLVKTIQTDTNEAVISMEKSTSGVVSGTRLAQDAGKALGEIEGVSVNLARLIQDISQAAGQQMTMANSVSSTMKVIQGITTQTSEGTKQAAESIGELTGMADSLKKSVAGFKLPA